MSTGVTRWAEAHIESHAGVMCVCIRVPVAVLPAALQQNPRDDSYYSIKVTDESEFAADVVRELNHEEEDGTTPVHELFDRAMASAIDNGSLACEYTESATKEEPTDGKA